MTSYHESLFYLYGLQQRGVKYGLRNIRSLVRKAGYPQDRFSSIHIAGTNGKGSTASFLASILTEAGYRTGLYTSPHLVRFTERIRIDGKEITEERLVEYVDRLRTAIETTRATFFEATTCIAFCYFADEKIDVAVLETGLGGRLDATNVVTPLVSVITTIDMDHQEYLGNTLESIAREKAGIIKPGVPVVTTEQDEGVLGVLKRVSRRKRSPFYQAEDVVHIRAVGRLRGREHVSLQTRHFSPGKVSLGHRGMHQIRNATLAVAAVEILLRRRASRHQLALLDNSSVRRGLSGVLSNTGLRGRFETGRRGHARYILDVAHNPNGVAVLAEALRADRRGCTVAVFGAMKDKDHVGMLRGLMGVVPHIVAVRPRIARALSAGALVRSARTLGFGVTNGRTVREGILRAFRIADQAGGASRRSVLVTGSHYTVGEAISFFEEKS